MGIEVTMKSMMVPLLAGSLALAGCHSPVPAFDAEKARVISDLETRVAVARIGVQVCRSYSVGVSEQNWVRGRVTALEGENVIVTVDDPGRFVMDVAGQRLRKGVLLKESPRSWVPCL